MSGDGGGGGGDRGPRDRHLVLQGRMPVLEALADGSVPVARVLLAQGAQGDNVQRIEQLARRRGLPCDRVDEDRISRLAGGARHHQGVVADVAPPGLGPLADYLEHRHGRRHATSLLVLDGVHNPANVGMIIRSATAAGLDGIVVPHRGTAELGPLVLKASAGIALRATLLRAETAAEAVTALVDARFRIVGLDANHPGAEPLPDAELPERAAYVLGNESEGVSVAVAEAVDTWVSMPLHNDVESLNVACAATLVAFEVARRRR